ncbi:hypothetical protein [Parasitella parasitica]|uniref:C2H2-type domain-containing protein n=1 Tax=Parasitella parasitica TaxID=35722 RepID=A0A0B7NH92_9FUNG|nr:hypothetical protein [Parasitella parasitica]
MHTRSYSASCFPTRVRRPIRPIPTTTATNAKKVYPGRFNYCKHLFSAHGIVAPADKLAGSKVKPLADDPNNSCRTCDKTLSSQSNYSYHILAVHDINNGPSRERNKKGSTTIKTLDVDDPNHYCCACKHKIANKYRYRMHFLTEHQSMLNSIRHALRNVPDPEDPNFYYSVCNEAFKTPVEIPLPGYPLDDLWPASS